MMIDDDDFDIVWKKAQEETKVQVVLSKWE